MTQELESIRQKLQQFSHPEKIAFLKNYMTSPYNFTYGLKVPDSREIAREYKNLDLYNVYNLFDELWRTGNHEEMSLAIHILQLHKKKFNQETWQFLKPRLEKARTWDHIDWLATDIISELLLKNIISNKEIKEFSDSKNPWMRRIAVESTYKLIKQNKLELTFRLAEKLVYDEDKFVQKGAGWMLREAGKRNRIAVSEFIKMHMNMKNIAFSYSTEKIKELRKIRKEMQEKEKKYGKIMNKVGAIIIKDRKILVCKKKDLFIFPGGKKEKNEDDFSCLKRELKEELGVDVIGHKYFGSFEDEATLDPGLRVKITAYLAEINGNPKASREIEEIKYINSKENINLGSILKKFVLPELVKLKLIE